MSHTSFHWFGCELITKVFDHKFDIFSVDCSVNKNSSRTKKLSPSSNTEIPHFDVNENLLQELNGDSKIHKSSERTDCCYDIWNRLRQSINCLQSPVGHSMGVYSI